MEHRWGERIDLDLQVRLDARPGALATGQLRNVSLSGAYVRTAARIPPLTRLYLELERQCRSRGEPNRIPAYVSRADGQGVALEWCEFAPAAIHGLLADAAVRNAESGSVTAPDRGKCVWRSRRPWDDDAARLDTHHRSGTKPERHDPGGHSS